MWGTLSYSYRHENNFLIRYFFTYFNVEKHCKYKYIHICIHQYRQSHIANNKTTKTSNKRTRNKKMKTGQTQSTILRQC